MVEEYFEDYTNKYYEMKKALKRYIEAKEDYYHLTGINLDDMPKGNQKPLGLDDLLGNIEQLNNEYIARKKELEEAEEKCRRKAYLDNRSRATYRMRRRYWTFSSSAVCSG